MKKWYNHFQRPWLVFLIFFCLCLAAGACFSFFQTGSAAPAQANDPQEGISYAGPETCKTCHEELYNTWQATRHAQAFSSPIFQRDWKAEGSAFTCLECHTTGYDAANSSYAHEGITCESCHGPFQPGHPKALMTITPDAELCARCHKSTTDEWRSSPHHQANIQCQACHNPHSQTPRAATVTELCTNCHKQMEDTFAHGTHASAGLECSNCHMYTAPREKDAIMGLVPTGHTFTVGSETCIGCHQDTVHTRDTLLKLSGESEVAPAADAQTLEQQVNQQKAQIEELEAQSSVRLYTGLAQGAIVGLVTGAAAAWVVSKRMRVVEVEDD